MMGRIKVVTYEDALEIHQASGRAADKADRPSSRADDHLQGRKVQDGCAPRLRSLHRLRSAKVRSMPVSSPPDLS